MRLIAIAWVLVFHGVALSFTECIHTLSDSPFSVKIYPGSEEVVYVFPGLGESLRAWERPKSLSHPVKKHWLENNISAPTIVLVVSSSARFFSSRRTRFTEPGDSTIEKILALEKRFPFQVKKRSALGISMGAYNLMYLTLQRPDLFQKLALIVPPFVEREVRHHSREYLAWAWRTAARRTDLKLWKRMKFAAFLLSLPPLIRPGFSNESVLDHFVDIGTLFERNYAWEQFPKIYLSAAQQDEFNFYPGAVRFHNLGTQAGLNIQWQPLAGNHQDYDAVSIAEFLSPQRD